MKHSTRKQRLSRSGDQRRALIDGLVRGLIVHERVSTTLARAREAQRLAEGLISLGKDGSVHARRRAFRVLQDRALVKKVFAEIAPRFTDTSGGYTRLVRLGMRRGDGARRALLSFSVLPAAKPSMKPKPQEAKPPEPSKTPSKVGQAEELKEPKQPKGFFEGLRSLWGKKKKKGNDAP